MSEAGKDVPGTCTAVLESQPFAGVRHSSASLDEPRETSLKRCLGAAVPQSSDAHQKQGQERAQPGIVPGLEAP